VFTAWTTPQAVFFQGLTRASCRQSRSSEERFFSTEVRVRVLAGRTAWASRNAAHCRSVTVVAASCAHLGGELVGDGVDDGQRLAGLGQPDPGVAGVADLDALA
jgi:hypothetical protein